MTQPENRKHQPRVSEAVFREWNEAMIDVYDPEAYHTRSPWIIRGIIAMLLRRIQALLQITPGDRVLEVGCGAGNVLERLAGPRILAGLDLSPRLLDKARSRCPEGAVLLAGRAEQMPLRSGEWDKVL